jgi:preprotein translocase subunit SecD
MKKTIILAALLYIPVAGAEYKCVDSKGITHVGDTPPAGCADVPLYEISKSGRILQKIDATPTPEQLKLRLEEADRKKEAEKQAHEQKRKDLALLNTYSTEREVDVARDRNVEPIVARIRSAEERLRVVEKREKQLNDELEFYKAGQSKSAKGRDDATRREEAPPALVFEAERIRREKETLTKGIVTHGKEIEALKAKYDSDKQRWVALKTGLVAKPIEYVGAQAKPEPEPSYPNNYYDPPRRRRY